MRITGPPPSPFPGLVRMEVGRDSRLTGVSPPPPSVSLSRSTRAWLCTHTHVYACCTVFSVCTGVYVCLRVYKFSAYTNVSLQELYTYTRALCTRYMTCAQMCLRTLSLCTLYLCKISMYTRVRLCGVSVYQVCVCHVSVYFVSECTREVSADGVSVSPIC